MYLSKIIIFILCFQIITFSANCAELNDSKLLEDSVNDMYTVAGAGIGGAVLGLSTLSFVEEPGDHLKNILVGAALGVMGGVAFVGYTTANKGREIYYEGGSIFRKNKDFSTNNRISWHRREIGKVSFRDNKEIPVFVWSSLF